MKTLLIIFSLLFSLSVFADIAIVSDLDDTIKITEAGGDPTDIIGEDVFTGIPEFFEGAKEYATSLHIVSASPLFLRSKIKKLLKNKSIEYNSLTLRRNVFEDKFTYKVRAIKKILDETNDDAILIGDDLGKDPEVFSEIKRQFGNRVLATYVHKVNGRPFESGVSFSYWTTFDLVLREFEAYRMDPSVVETISSLLLSAKDMELIFPRKAECPSEAAIWDWQTRSAFSIEALKLIEKFTGFCQARQSDIILP